MPSARALLRLTTKLDQMSATGVLALGLEWLNNNFQTVLTRQAQQASATRLPELLIAVDNDLHWSRHFLPVTRQDTRTAEDVCQVVATIMAHGCNIGPATMAQLTQGVRAAAIQRLTDWHLHEETLRAALADTVSWSLMRHSCGSSPQLSHQVLACMADYIPIGTPRRTEIMKAAMPSLRELGRRSK
jgi:hypothetical protein